MGTPSYGVDYETQYDFLQIGTITSAQAALAVTARDNVSVDDLAAIKKVIWRPDQGTAAAILRFRVDGTEDDAPVIEMYGAKGADYYTRIATLTLAQGTQDWSGGHFVDEITLSNEAWAHGIRADSVTDEVGRVVFNTGGFDRFLFIASTLTVTTVHIDIARLDKQIDHGIEIHSAILVLADNMTMSDVVSAISDMHSGLDSILGSVLDDTSETVSVLSIIHDDTVDIASATDATRKSIDSGLSAQLSSLMTDTEAVDAAVDAVESAISAGLSNIVDQNSSIMTDLGGLANQNSSLLTSLDAVKSALDDNTDSIEAALILVESEIVSVHSQAVLIKTAVDLVRSTLSDTIATDLTGMQNQLSSVMTDLDGVRAAVSDMDSAQSDAMVTLEADVVSCHSQLVLNVAAVTGVRSGILSVATETHSILHSVLDDTSATVVGITGVRSGNLSAATRIVTAVDLIETAISDMDSALSDAMVTLEVAVSNNTSVLSGCMSTLENDVETVRSGNLSAATLLETTLEAIDSDIVALESALSGHLSDVVAAVGDADATSAVLAMDSAVSGWFVEHEAGIRSGVKSAVTSAIGALMDGENISDVVDAVDLITVEVSTAVSNLKAEVSDAISNLKSALIAHGDIGLISGPETVAVDSDTQTLSELGIALDANIRRITLIPENSGISWADGAATAGVNPLPNAVTQIDCTRAQILTREFVCPAASTYDMQVIQEG